MLPSLTQLVDKLYYLIVNELKPSDNILNINYRQCG